MSKKLVASLGDHVEHVKEARGKAEEVAMNHTIYRGPGNGVKLVLTTDSPSSSHGIPVLRVEGAGDWPDMGPGDCLPNGRDAGEAVAALVAAGKPPEGIGGTCPKGIRSPEVRDAARRFLAQWPEGPQLAADAEVTP